MAILSFQLLIYIYIYIIFTNREGLDLKPNAVDELVTSTQNDIRQVINILSTYRLNESGMDYDQAKKV